MFTNLSRISQMRVSFLLLLLTPRPSKSNKQILRVGPGFLTGLLRHSGLLSTLHQHLPRAFSRDEQRAQGRGLRRTDGGTWLQLGEGRGERGARSGAGRGGSARSQSPSIPPPRPPRAERGGGARRWRRRQRRRRRLPWGGMERGGGSGAERRQPRRCRAAGAAARLPVLPPASARSR